MRERCCDAMSIFSKWGSPDLFITFTANPSWKEIINNLQPGEHASDRPDLVARVFKIKLDALIKDITTNGIFGKSIAYVYCIEFQKRGLPHAHILLTLIAQDKFTTPERIDKFICAEVPGEESPRLRQIVLKCMMHGPCGINHPNAPCMKDGHCSKHFPKDFNEQTLPNLNGYPSYRRRRGEQVTVRGSVMDNRNVVPYNPYLTLKYNAHINVECSTSLRFVKYIYKYIFKGFDCANVTITPDGQSELRYNEITNFIDCRYVSAPEAMWRLRESKMHDRSHAVIRLPVHLPNQQRVIFEEGHEEEALLAAQTGKTKLEAYFKLNENNPIAREFIYTDISYHFVYVRGQWQERQRGGDKTVARMYTVSVKDEERFYLRLLLLHVVGATSFESLRTVDGVVCETFKAAAMVRGLLESDEEWDRCMTDAGIYLMPKQLRELFAYIIVFCHPSQPLKLWQDHLQNLILDHIRGHTEEVASNLSLHEINFILMQHGMSCGSVGLPKPTGEASGNETVYDQEEEARQATMQFETLNPAQMNAFTHIMLAVENTEEVSKLFYLDGPGGSGKTYLYTTLMAYFRGRGMIVLPFATTGIAATLLKGGRTVHSGFKLPVPLLDTSVSSMRLNSPEAKILHDAALIVIDEITMLSKNGLRCIDKLLRDIMSCDTSFGGKVLVLGGDFRQTLPVVPRGSRTEIIETCIKSSRLWNQFQQFSLSTNMRSEGQHEHNQWLLSVGSGSLPQTAGIYEDDTIQIPDSMVTKDDLISVVFGNIQGMSVEDLSKRVIVAPTNAHTLEMNRKIIDTIPGEAKIYYSADSIVSEDPSDTLNFPVEFLNEQTPSGMPPHVLLLKKGVIIMLLRNLNPKKGMCNGTRLIVEELSRNIIKAKIISECNKGESVLIPRIDLAPTETTLPFILRRRQFPVMPAYAITINKSQGQSFDYIGINLQSAVFSHGQMYVALSRSRNSTNVKVHIEENAQQGPLLKDHRQFTRNVVYREIL